MVVNMIRHFASGKPCLQMGQYLTIEGELDASYLQGYEIWLQNSFNLDTDTEAQGYVKLKIGEIFHGLFTKIVLFVSHNFTPNEKPVL